MAIAPMTHREVIEKRLHDVRKRRETVWQMVSVYLSNRDAHGVMDMGAELEALDRAIKELEAVL